MPQAFTLYNSTSRQKENYTPLQAGQISLYVCGMTVYDYCHIGHARVLIGFDVIVRYLRSIGWNVKYVRNITDIDDKIIKRANERNQSIEQITSYYIDAMNEDAGRLYCIPPDVAPKATQYIEQMQTMIGKLIHNNYAYAVPNGDVYYRVEQFANYGKLSGRNLADMQAGASERVEADSDKQNPFDFVLWKSAKPLEPQWHSPWGGGRPGWHIECSAMSTCCLGNHFDIHGGGGDLLFPHHENEIAQSEGATGEKYVNYWMHMGFVNVDGEKMSKSLGNFFTIRDVMQSFDPEVIRFFIIGSHYRSPINFSDVALKEAKNALSRFYNTLKAVPSVNDTAVASEQTQQLINDLTARFHQAMQDDFNTPEAVAVLFELAREINRAHKTEQTGDEIALAQLLKTLAEPLAILQRSPQEFLQSSVEESTLSETEIEAQIAARQQAKANKNFALADQIRNDLLAQGVVLEDSRAGTTWRREG